MRKMLNNKKIILLAMFILLAVCDYASAGIKVKVRDYASDLDIREGDFVFQHLPGRLTRVIADVTNSQYSHCGIVVNKPEGLYVLEAIGPVKETPLHYWIARGVGARVAVVRLKEEYRKKIPAIVKAAYHYRNLSYDIQYEWDDSKIYCSELIYKAAQKGAGIALAQFVKLGDLDWRHHEKFIRYITGGTLPLNREMITPHDLVYSDKVDIVYSSFPAQVIEDMRYAVSDLEGAWSGDYIFIKNQLIQATIAFDESGRIKKGKLAGNIFVSSGKLLKHNKKTGQFTYHVYDTNGTKTTIYARMDPTKDALFGTWKDSRGYTGVFSLVKIDTNN